MEYWAGIDCSGFVYRTMASAAGLLGDLVSMSMIDTYNFTNAKAVDYLNVKNTFDNNRVYKFNSTLVNKLRKGDLIEYKSKRGQMGIDHTSTVYSNRANGCNDKGENCTYEIIHAYGVDCTDYDKKTGECKAGTFSRKVLKTPNKFKGFPNPTGFGRIKLWD